MKFWSLILIVVAASGCRPQSDSCVKMSLDFGPSNKESTVRVLYQDSSYISILDSVGKAQLTLKGVKPSGYATLFAPRSIKEIYLEDGKDLSVSNVKRGIWSFGGTGKATNEYLNSPFVSTIGIDASLEETDYIKEWEKSFVKIHAYLDSISLPVDFKKIEEKRLYYLVSNMLLDYPLHHCRQMKLSAFSPSENYYSALKRVLKEDKDASDLWIYRQTFKNWITALVRKDFPEQTPAQTLQHLLDQTKKTLQDRTLQEFISSIFLNDYLESYGIEAIEKPFLQGMKELSESPRKSELEKKYEEYNRLTQGKPAPDFCLDDTEGKKVSLSDFKGKLVYIDVWASWCRPCCNELPSLHKLEESLKGKDIAFVSVSIDQKKEEWLKKIEQEHLQGIQLHLGKDINFRKDYRVGQIPHFILIDKQGKIINANMTRPSNPETLNTLKEYLE